MKNSGSAWTSPAYQQLGGMLPRTLKKGSFCKVRKKVASLKCNSHGHSKRWGIVLEADWIGRELLGILMGRKRAHPNHPLQISSHTVVKLYFLSKKSYSSSTGVAIWKKMKLRIFEFSYFSKFNLQLEKCCYFHALITVETKKHLNWLISLI